MTPAEGGAVPLVLAALRFAARKHRDQRRKGEEASPYINHPIEVAHVLSSVGGVHDPAILAAAVLHDTLEDTETTPDELETVFGPTVRRMVEEVSDDTTLARSERRARQVACAPDLSEGAKLVRLADKICNVFDVTHAPPSGWSPERRLEYLEWTARVVEGCEGVSPRLEAHYRRLLEEGRHTLRRLVASKST